MQEENIGINMVRPDLDHLPKHATPGPYSIRPYRPGDEQAWRQIHLEARIVLTLAHAGPLSLDVYDVRGRLMRTLYGGRQEPGVHEFVWNGRDDLGRECASGNYLVRMRAGVYEKTQKIVLVE